MVNRRIWGFFGKTDAAARRKAGLPVTTAWMESLVKEVDYRVKGTEMFWNNPTGAEPDSTSGAVAEAGFVTVSSAP